MKATLKTLIYQPTQCDEYSTSNANVRDFRKVFMKLPQYPNTMPKPILQLPETDDSYNYMFPALRGIQAGREYYVAMCPLKLVPKIFSFNESDIPAELRAQRVLNKARIPGLAKYITDNPQNYAFSSLTASIDRTVKFVPFKDKGSLSHTGQLFIPMGAKILINDGQHRRAAIELALQVNPDLGEEAISIVFFLDAGLKRSQQLFADLNKYAIRPTRSLGILYDNRDSFANLAKDLIDKVDLFKGLTEVEKTTISNRSNKLFTLSTIYQATRALLNKEFGKGRANKSDEELAIEFWTELPNHIKEWKLAIERKISCSELRKDYIHSHGIALHAIGRMGSSLVNGQTKDWKNRLNRIDKIDWTRTNPIWEGRAVIGGRLSKSPMNVILTANYLKQAMDLKLTAQEIEAESMIRKKS